METNTIRPTRDEDQRPVYSKVPETGIKSLGITSLLENTPKPMQSRARMSIGTHISGETSFTLELAVC